MWNRELQCTNLQVVFFCWYHVARTVLRNKSDIITASWKLWFGKFSSGFLSYNVSIRLPFLYLVIQSQRKCNNKRAVPYKSTLHCAKQTYLTNWICLPCYCFVLMRKVNSLFIFRRENLWTCLRWIFPKTKKSMWKKRWNIWVSLFGNYA